LFNMCDILTTSILMWNELYLITKVAQNNVEERMFIKRSGVHFKVANVANCNQEFYSLYQKQFTLRNNCIFTYTSKNAVKHVCKHWKSCI